MSKRKNTSSTLIKKGLVQLTNEFIESLDERVDLIESGIREGEYTIAIDESHKLKGVAGTFGFPEITDCCHEIEQNLRNCQYEQMDHFLAKLLLLKDAAIKK